MKHIILSAALTIGSLMGLAQTIENREIKPFKHLNVSGGAHVILMQSDSFLVKVSASDSEDLKNISTTSDGETLIIKNKSGLNGSYKVTVYGHDWQQVVSSGASKIESGNDILSDSLDIDATGASNTDLHLKTRIIHVISSGASLVQLEGNTGVLYSVVSGASTLKAYKLNASKVDVITSGASTAKVYAIDKINANASGASTIKFKGEPTEVGAEASASSTIAKVSGDDSQKKRNDSDSTTFNFKKKKFIIIDRDDETEGSKKTTEDSDFHHWAGFSMGVNGWMASGGNIVLPKNIDYMALNYGKSLNFQLNPFEKTIHLHKNYVNLVTGIGFEWNQYEFSNKVTLNPDSSFTFGKIDSTGIDFKKNRFKSTFVNVPLLLEFNISSSPKKTFHIAVGVIGGYRLGSRTRQIYEVNHHSVRDIRKDQYNMNPFRVNAHASLGYGNWTFFADYALTPLFESGKGPLLYPFTIGIRIVPFS